VHRHLLQHSTIWIALSVIYQPLLIHQLFSTQKIYVYPYMQHFGISGIGGANPYTPKKCDCATDDGKDDYCDDFDLMIGFVFFEAAALARDVTVNFQYLLDMMYKNDDRSKMNEEIYEAAFSIQRMGGEAAKYPPKRPESVSQSAYNFSRGNLTDKDWREEIYSFCNKQCAVFSFRLYDEFNRFVNPANFDLEAGGCQDTFYTDDTPFNVAAATPPVPLVQDYVGAYRQRSSPCCCAAAGSYRLLAHPLCLSLSLSLRQNAPILSRRQSFKVSESRWV
jgi:hypothetical protein